MTNKRLGGFVQILIVILLALLLLKNASQPNYLFEWDERFHALVAKNLSEDFSIPRLYSDSAAVHYDYGPWYRTVIWLHKPPLFSYQAAMLMKIFGANLLTYRLNGLFTLLLLGLANYLILRLYDLKKWQALALSFAAIFSLNFLKLSNGVLGMGQNDLSFIMWISYGVLFAEKARLSEGRKVGINIFLVAIFSSLAVLTKFLVGFLPFLLLGITALRAGWNFKAWLQLLAWALMPLLALGGWYWYTYQIAPELTLAEFTYNSRHFSEALEGHNYGPLFHISWFVRTFSIPLLLILLGLVIVYSRKGKLQGLLNLPKAFFNALFTIFFVILFFTIAKTKLPAFTFVAAPLLMVAIGILYQHLSIETRYKAYLFLIPMLGVFVGALYILGDKHRNIQRECEQEFYTHLGESLPENAVLFNVADFTYPEAMFYSGLISYEKMPDPFWVEEAKARGYLPYLILRGGENDALKQVFEGRFIKYTCN